MLIDAGFACLIATQKIHHAGHIFDLFATGVHPHELRK